MLSTNWLWKTCLIQLGQKRLFGSYLLTFHFAALSDYTFYTLKCLCEPTRCPETHRFMSLSILICTLLKYVTAKMKFPPPFHLSEVSLDKEDAVCQLSSTEKRQNFQRLCQDVLNLYKQETNLQGHHHPHHI